MGFFCTPFSKRLANAARIPDVARWEAVQNWVETHKADILRASRKYAKHKMASSEDILAEARLAAFPILEKLDKDLDCDSFCCYFFGKWFRSWVAGSCHVPIQHWDKIESWTEITPLDILESRDPVDTRAIEQRMDRLTMRQRELCNLFLRGEIAGLEEAAPLMGCSVRSVGLLAKRAAARINKGNR